MTDSDGPLLYGVPGAEVLHLDPVTVYELSIDPWLDEPKHRPAIIEEWSARPIGEMLMSADLVIEHVIEMFEEGDEYCADQLGDAAHDPDVIAAFDAAVKLLGSKCSYLMADTLRRSMQVTWNEQGEPLLDGLPLLPPKKPTVDELLDNLGQSVAAAKAAKAGSSDEPGGTS